jgi:phospholipid/cholesterol/gamma-HCH transport system substrate-binding protein
VRRALMLKYRAGNVRAGFIGAILILLIIAVGLSPERLWSWATSIRYAARFAEASNLAVGNPVVVSGMKVGTVSDISLSNGDALVTFSVDADVTFGSATTAHIKTGTLLGQRVLTLESAGARVMHPNDVIPLSRTSSPYLLTDAVSGLTTDVAGTDTAALNQSLDTLSSTLDQIAPELGPTFDGLTRLSKALNERDGSLGELLKHGGDVASILAKRSEQVNTLILNANDLVEVLAARRQAIVGLLANASAVARQLSGLVHDNEQQLAPTLDKLNSVVAVLEKNRDNIARALPGLAKYQATLGETVASGPYYTTFVANSLPQMLQPFLDYAFGFRRGDIAGKRPGPRAEFPFPYNAIPQPGERWPR